MVEVSKEGTPRLTRSEAMRLLIEASPELADKPWWWPRLDAIPGLAPEPSVLSGDDIIGILHPPEPSEPRRDWLLLGGDASAERLAALIASKVRLRKRGQTFYGLCPFHNEASPSFAVYQAPDKRGRYYCHGCGAKGDAIDWLRKVDGLSYGEAVKALNGELRAKADYHPADKPKPLPKACPSCAADGLTLCWCVHIEAPEKPISPLQAYRDRNPDCCLPDWAIDV